jgi:SAM-dependent methyltransferase
MHSNIVKSQFPWITYNEPEGHLDDLVELIEVMGFLSHTTFVAGLSYKDDTTLERCNRKGVRKIYRYDQINDLGINDPLAGLETIQEKLDAKLTDELAIKHGQADVLFVRHILEHSHDPQCFLESCHRLVRPGGLIVIEVPDCQKIFNGVDHCFIWEEHISYFTKETLYNFLQIAGFRSVDIRVYPYPVEDSLVAIVTNQISLRADKALLVGTESICSAKNFAYSFSRNKTTIETLLDKWLQQRCRMALFGAGHLAAKFVNFYGLRGRFVGAIDDNPHKQRLFLPGSALPVIASTCLDDGEIDLCLLTLGLESELKVRKAKSAFLERGGEFRSIFSASASSIYEEAIR